MLIINQPPYTPKALACCLVSSDPGFALAPLPAFLPPP